MRKMALSFGILVLVANLALAEESTKNSKAAKSSEVITTEQRHKMADLHEKLAACLRSESPILECHLEMRKSCLDSVGMDGCPMMMGGKMGRGMPRQMMGVPSQGNK